MNEGSTVGLKGYFGVAMQRWVSRQLVARQHISVLQASASWDLQRASGSQNVLRHGVLFNVPPEQMAKVLSDSDALCSPA